MIALRKIGSGEPVGAGSQVRVVSTSALVQGLFEIADWDEVNIEVYAFKPGKATKAEVYTFKPSALGLYIGHEAGEPIYAIKWGTGSPQFPPTIQAALIVDAYKKARERAKSNPDGLLARAMATGVQDFMVQIMKAVGSGVPAIDVLLEALTEDSSIFPK